MKHIDYTDYANVEFNLLKQFAERLGVRVELKDKAEWNKKYKDMDGLLYGDGKGNFREIDILRKAKTSDAVKILSHELAHMYLHPDRNTVNDAEADKQADDAGQMLIEFARFMIINKEF